jgi:hypothetical protein
LQLNGIETAEIDTLREIGNRLKTNADNFRINNSDERLAAGELLVTIRTERKLREERMERVIEPLRRAKKEATDLLADLRDPLLEAEKPLTAEMSRFDLAERARLKAVEAATTAELRGQIEDLAVDVAAALEAEGRNDEAAAVLEDAIAAPAAALVLPAARAAGESARKSFVYKITDPAQVSREFLVVDEKKIGQTVRALGPAAEKLVGGIIVEESITYAVRRG